MIESHRRESGSVIEDYCRGVIVVWLAMAAACDSISGGSPAVGAGGIATSCVDGASVTVSYDDMTRVLPYQELYRYGGIESEPLGRVLDVALGRSGTVYISDPIVGVVHALISDVQVIPIGRRGEGPGEFLVPSQVSEAGDTVFVFDARMWRLSSFASDGRFLGSTTPPTTLDIGQVPALVLAGSVLYNLEFPIEAQEDLMAAAGSDRVLRVTNSIARWNVGADRWTPIRDVPSVEVLVRGGITNAPFGKRPLWDISQDEGSVWYADTGEVIVDRIDGNGDTDCRIVGIDFPDNPLTNEDRRRFFDASDVNTSDTARVAAVRRSRQDTRLPDSEPVLEDLVAGNDGGFAITLSAEAPGEYLMFDREGIVRGRLILDPRSRLGAFGDTLAVVIESDALDVETVVLVRLDQASGGRP